MVAGMILNQNWILTSITIFITFSGKVLFLGLRNSIFVGVIAPQYSLLALVLSIVTYLIEMKLKTEFL